MIDRVGRHPALTLEDWIGSRPELQHPPIKDPRKMVPADKAPEPRRTKIRTERPKRTVSRPETL